MHPHERLTNLPPHVDRSSMIPTGLRPSASDRRDEPPATCNDGLRPDTKFETRLEALRRENRERIGQTEAAIAASEAAGTLWTVQAALYAGRAFALVYHGRMDDTEPLESQHRDAGGVFGPVFLIGKTHKEAMAETLKLFTVDEITIRTVRKR